MKKEGGRINSLSNKRGLSGVVITLIMILLGLVVAGTIWVIVNNLVSEGSEGISLSGVTIDLEIADASVSGTTLTVKVERQPGEGDLTGVNLVISDGTNQDAVRREIDLEPYETRTLTVESTELSQVGLATIDQVSVAPIYNTEEGVEKIGGIVDTFDMASSSGDAGDTGGDGTGDAPDEGGGTCTDGETDACGNTEGVCGTGIIEQECVDGIWAACDYSLISNYEEVESTCDDGLDNDCDGLIDDGDPSCAAPETCNGVWDIDDEGVNECDGTSETAPNCNLDACTCNAGYESADPQDGTCVVAPAVNTGTVYTVWPEGASSFFDSNDLPGTQLELQEFFSNHYVEFVGTGDGCIGILDGGVPETGRSYLELISDTTAITGDAYNIWETTAGCPA